jgi:heptosyltransferase-2
MFHKILVVQTAFIGDVLLTTPLLKAVRQLFPYTTISVLVRPPSQSLLKNNPDVDEILIYDKRGSDRGIKAFFRVVKELRKSNFNLALSPHRSLRTALLLWMAGIPKRIGFKTGLGQYLYHHRVPFRSYKHDIERNLSLLAPLTLTPKIFSTEMVLPVTQEDQAAATQLLEKAGVDLKRKPLIGISPGSIWPTKRWIPEKFSELIPQLIENYRGTVLLLGSGEDVNLCKKISSQCRFRSEEHRRCLINLAGQTTLSDLAAIIDRCDLFITNDSGPMHIASARKIPTVAIFGSTVPSQGYAPLHKKAVVVEKTLPCRPCGEHGRKKCPQEHFLCMQAITVEEVLEAAERLLSV